ncbi:MAG: hypothetical protein PWQ55_236 [Chloroflexota bacterium]|nr:hypothetical protein [Chloroflexota bacterium]
MSFKDTLKHTLPDPLLSVLKNGRDGLQRLPDDIQASTHPWRQAVNTRLRPLHNVYQGKRCFVIGNGPSLKNTDMSKLRDEYTFGMNRIYLMFPELGFETSFFVSINDLVIEQCAPDIQKLDIPKFIAWHAHQWLQPDDNMFFLHTSYTGPKFATDLTKRLWEGATVTYVALQVAYYLGFSEVILIGVDHSFATKGKPNTTIVSEGDDPNHFNPAYFGKGFRWQLPDLDTSEVGYAMARQAFEADGRRVLDATVGGRLTIFPKVEYDSLFD